MYVKCQLKTRGKKRQLTSFLASFNSRGIYLLHPKDLKIN